LWQWSTKTRMVQITRGVHSVDDLGYPVLNVGFISYILAEDVKIYAHWIDAAYLSQNPSYHGPPSHEQIKELFQKFGVKMEDLDQ
jgi:hypothetical protein